MIVLYYLLDRICVLNRHRDCCWVMNEWAVGQWILRKTPT